jgi:hypothetical protein
MREVIRGMRGQVKRMQSRYDLQQQNTLPPQFVNCVFDGDVWYTAKPGGRMRHSWSRIELRDGTKLTSPIDADLLRASKLCLVLIAFGGATTRRAPRGSSFDSYFTALRQLLIWVSSRRVFSFRDLTLPHVVGYRNFLQHHSIGKGAHKRSNSIDGKGRSPLTQLKVIQIVRYLVRLHVK